MDDMDTPPVFFVPCIPTLQGDPFFGSCGSNESRWNIYESTWNQYLNNIQDTTVKLDKSVVTTLVEEMHHHNNSSEGRVKLFVTESPDSSILEALDVDGFNQNATGMHAIRLYPSDCSSLQSLVFNVVKGFVIRSQPILSMSDCTLDLLEAWIKHHGAVVPRLLILLHEFERVQTDIIEDFWYILSRRSAALTLAFVISTPEPTTCVRERYSKHCPAFVELIELPSSISSGLVIELILKTFLDANFDPHHLMSAAMLGLAFDYGIQHCTGLTSLLNIIQVAHLRRVFCGGSSGEFIEPATHVDFLDALDGIGRRLTRQMMKYWSKDHITAVASYRARFTPEKGFAYHLAILLYAILRELDGGGLTESWLLKLFSNDENSFKHDLYTIICRLCPEKMGRLLDHLCIYTEQVPSEGQPPDFGLRLRALRNASLDGNLPISDVEELLFRCLGTNLASPPLQEASPMFVYEQINPSLGVALPFALMQPSQYTIDSNILVGLDPCIIFQRSLESGKFINVYDWYQSFHTLAEEPATPYSKAKAKRTEALSFEAQARFMRSVKELESVGLIKQSSRKQGQIQRAKFYSSEWTDNTNRH